ncbi:MAG: ABC transporter permease [Alphaproteobacteria bacterium]|nr:ABC transporter permease [Alphaproteobacteria bacterium]
MLFALAGYDTLRIFAAFFVTPLSTTYGLAEIALKASPLALCAVGLAIGFRANVWNIGAEGQFTAGAIAGGGLALATHGMTGWWILPAMLAAGALGGMAWSAVPALLRTRFGANEILTSLMLAYVAVLLLGWLVHGPWKDPDGFRFPESRQFEPDAQVPILIDGTRLNAGALVALAAIAVAWVFVHRSIAGYRMTVVGAAEGAARFAGFRTGAAVWTTFLAGGAAAGLAGVLEVAGPIGQLLPTISPGYGFAAIIVAFLGRLDPIGVGAASLLMALLYIGAETAQVELGLPPSVSGVFQGLLLVFLLATDTLMRYRVRRLAARKAGA